MKIPKEIKKWMREHTVQDLEEYLLNDEYADTAQKILDIISELNGDTPLNGQTMEEIYA